MLKEEMKTLLDETFDAQERCDGFYDKAPQRAAPAPPASDEELRRLEQHLNRRGLKLPPSLRTLLSVYDGIEGYMRTEELSIRSASEIESEQSRGGDEGWDDFAPCHQFIIGEGTLMSFVAFNPETVMADGEMAVVMLQEDGEIYEFDDLYEFLRSHLEYLLGVIEVNEANRANLPDD